MLAHGSLARWAATKTSASDLPQLARFLSHTLRARHTSDLPIARAISRAYVSALNARRSYATTTAAATKPTATVKKAVKAQAQSSARPKRAAATKSTTTTAKKPAKKRTATKAKAKAKPKAKAKKPAPKKVVRKKKVLTPEEKQKAQIRELRKAALREPVSSISLSAYNVFVGEFVKNKQQNETASTAITQASQRYKDLTPAEREHYNHLTNERNAARQAEYKAWINTYTPAQIHAANNARLLLRRKIPKKTGSLPAHTTPLKDDRQVKRPLSSFIVFTTERWASGDMKGIAPRDAAKMISKEWKALSAGEKKKYEDAGAADVARYRRESAGTY